MFFSQGRVCVCVCRGWGVGGVLWLQCGMDDWLIGRTYTCANLIDGMSLCWCDKCFRSERVIRHWTDDWRCSVSWKDMSCVNGRVWGYECQRMWRGMQYTDRRWNKRIERKCPNIDFNVDKKNQLDVTFCILYFSSNSCSTCIGQPCAHHQGLTTAWCYSLVLVCAVAAGRWSRPVAR